MNSATAATTNNVADSPDRGLSGRCSHLCCPMPDFPPGWACRLCLLGMLVGSIVLCIGLFEAVRLSTHVLMSSCTVVSQEITEVGTCTVCDDRTNKCEVHPVAMARLGVTFTPLHAKQNTSSWVWYCKGLLSSDPCSTRLRVLDQMALDYQDPSQRARYRTSASSDHIPCALGDVMSYVKKNVHENQHDCYYNSRDPGGQDVWFTMPAPGLVDHFWFQQIFGYPVFFILSGMVLLSVLLACLTLEEVDVDAYGEGALGNPSRAVTFQQPIGQFG